MEDYMQSGSGKRLLIAVVDKSYPPNHSFVDGMLATAYPRQSGVRVLILCEQNPEYPPVIRHGKSTILNVLPKRSGLQRFSSYFNVRRMVNQLASRYRKRGYEVAGFVRNEPVYLIAALGAKANLKNIVFQSSFPHEGLSGRSVKQKVAQTFLHFALPRVDSIVTVSASATERVQQYAHNVPVYPIPLAVDDSFLLEKPLEINYKELEVLKLVYIGSHSSMRELHTVFAGCLRAFRMGVPLMLDSVGGSKIEIEQLRGYSSVKVLEQEGILRFCNPIPRAEIPVLLRQYHVGLSLIPPSPVYREASPTKLAEYCAVGLVVLASHGIPEQETFVRNSGGGRLTQFSATDIAEGIYELWRDRTEFNRMREEAFDYIARFYKYERFSNSLQEACWGR